MNKSIISKIEKLPIPLVPTMVGAATLSNIYFSMGYSYIRHITMFLSAIVLLTYLVKIITFRETFKMEYSKTPLSALYAGITMISMILGAYIFTYNNVIGKGIWFIAVILHTIHILIFTYRNVIKGVNIETFIPSWFVTYNGIMVAVVVGGVMNEPLINKIILYYGIASLFIIMPFMLYRLNKTPIKEDFLHTLAILLAPSSLCVVSYLNVYKEPNKIFVSILYLIVFITLIFVLSKLPKFFSYKFTPGFAGLTFPMAIGTLASIRVSGYLSTIGYEGLSNFIKEVSGIQLYITTAIIAFVVFNFINVIINIFKAE